MAAAGGRSSSVTSSTWIRQAIGEDRIAQATAAAAAMRLRRTLGLPEAAEPDDSLRFAANALELQASALLEDEDSEALRRAAADAFQVARALSQPDDPLARGESLVRLACYGVLGDRGADVKRLLEREELSKLAQNEAPWGTRVQAAVLEIWLRLLRKRGWEDLDALQQRIVGLRADQGTFEPGYLKEAEKRQDSRPAWDLVGQYHLAKAAELLGTFLTQGSVDGHFDIREQLQAQCDRAISASARGQRLEQEALSRLLARTSRMLIDNSIWTVTRSVNSRVTRFVTSQASRDREQPLFEMLAPQRRVLREQGLLGSGRRAVVVSLPTSSGKTFIAQFRMLQALNQFDYEGGWIAYLAPTRALVNQVTRRLRQDFSPLGIHVEKVSPALEMDGIEASLLTEEDPEAQFRVLITTPEKLDLLLRSGWEGKIGRPLTLVVVDEAHGLADPERGLKLELLLATINRECHHAQFLLLTPFVPNAGEVARWLAPDSYEAMEIAAEWVPNDRVVALAKPRKGEGSGEFHIELVPLHTTHPTLDVPEPFVLESARHCGLRQSEVSRSPGKLAAATAQLLRKRGTVIVLVDKPSNSWGVAKALRVRENRISPCESVIPQLRAFFEDELGPNFPLYPLLEHGVAVHHAGLSEDVRALIEWLTERGEVKTLVATTTLAQGVNFPVSGVVFASHQYPFGNDMPAEDFWNIAGRAGRVDQGDIGIIALAANNLEREKRLERFVGRAVGELNSTLIEMVRRVAQTGELSRLELLIREPGWSAFLQYLAHNYRQIGDQDAFASQI
ncbi:MAG: DEAD/DEAH box helicase, partial [Armatimonadetes bacterium]|nr:DEAD/DEAH box helicase [Armatimonadota bacterium]